MNLTLNNRLDQIPPLAEKIAAYLGSEGVPPEFIMTTNLCLDELLTNTIEYGYRDNEAHEINIDMKLENGELNIEIVDDAAPFDPTSDASTPDIYASIEERPIGGLGIFLVTHFSDSIQYNRQQNHNRLTLKKRLNMNTQA
ncbi:MAG: ATP-binding protein [bacterium]|nr:ATP-binding protein [bacterium]